MSPHRAAAFTDVSDEQLVFGRTTESVRASLRHQQTGALRVAICSGTDSRPASRSLGGRAFRPNKRVRRGACLSADRLRSSASQTLSPPRRAEGQLHPQQILLRRDRGVQGRTPKPGPRRLAAVTLPFCGSGVYARHERPARSNEPLRSFTRSKYSRKKR